MAKRYFGVLDAFSAVLMLASCFACVVGAAAASQRNLGIIDLGSTSTAEETSKAQAAFGKGDAIVVMRDRSPDQFKRAFGSSIPSSKAFSSTSNSPRTADSSAAQGQPLALRGVAAYIDARGVTRSVQTFAPANDPGDQKQGWKQHLNEWIAAEQTKALAAVGDPTPPAAAWTLLYQTTVEAEAGDYEQNTIAIYRLNGIDPTSDYYMVSTTPQVEPGWTGNCNGFDECDSHTVSRYFVHGEPTDNSTLVDHGPTGTVANGTVGFTIGGSLTAAGPGGTAGFSASWSQPDVTTVDQSVSNAAAWQETFQMLSGGSECNPLGGKNNVPGTSSGTFLSRQGSIFQVPGGTSDLNFPITTNATFCYWSPYVSPGIGAHYNTLSIQSTFPLGPPVLSASPQNLTIPAGGSALLRVNARIPNSNQGFPWQISTSTNTSWLSTNTGPFSGPQIIHVSVASGTSEGSKGTISINSVPSFAAPSVEGGPISIPVTVGQPSTDITAGVLLFGGETGYLTSPVQAPEFYDLSTKQFSPISPPKQNRNDHTATVLNNGDVLIAGGGTATAELYHPGTFSFSSTGSMANDRSGHTAVLLPDGKVLIVGGLDGQGNSTSSAELYDPTSGTFSPAGSLSSPRQGHGATAYVEGGQSKAIVYGGSSGSDILGTWEIWDESSNNFVSRGNMAYAVVNFPNPVAISSGDALHIVGGSQDGLYATAAEQLLQPPNFQPGASLQIPRRYFGFTALAAGGGLLATGGSTGGNVSALASAEIRTASGWQLLSGSATCPGAAGCMTTPRISHTETALPDGTVLLAGGHDGTGTVLGSTEYFDPAGKAFITGAPGVGRMGHTASLVSTTSSTLANNPPSTALGQSVELVAAVKSGLGTPEGSVQFLDGTRVLGTVPLKDGSATFTTTELALGSHTLTVVFSGGGGSGSSTSPAVTQQVGKTATTVAVAVSPNPSPVGQAVVLKATVIASKGAPSGTVTFSDGSTPLGAPQAVVNGSAQLATSSLSAGQHAITALYSGDSGFDGSSSPVFTEYVNSASTTLSATPNPSQAGQSLDLVATVESAAGGSPTGPVNFLDGAVLLGSSPLTNNKAKFTTSTLSVGAHSLTAVYTGDRQFPRSASAVITQTVNAANTATTTTLSSNPNPSTPRASVTLTATVRSAAGTTSTPTGSVTFKDQTTNTALGTTLLTTVEGAQVALLSTTALTSTGAHSIQAAYQGDTNFAASQSAAYTQTVLVTPTVDLIVNGSSAGATVSVGDTVTLVTRIHAAADCPWPTGSITISDSTNANNRYGSANIVKDPNSKDGLAEIRNAGIAAGSYTLVAIYGGDNEGKYYNGAQSNRVSLQVNTKGQPQ
jgi:Bacterial Ig-like domain (group 3)/Galactose oxidase, central domain